MEGMEGRIKPPASMSRIYVSASNEVVLPYNGQAAMLANARKDGEESEEDHSKLDKHYGPSSAMTAMHKQKDRRKK